MMMHKIGYVIHHPWYANQNIYLNLNTTATDNPFVDDTAQHLY